MQRLFWRSLIQDIGCKEDHRYDPENVRFQNSTTSPGTFMYQLYRGEDERKQPASPGGETAAGLPGCLTDLVPGQRKTGALP